MDEQNAYYLGLKGNLKKVNDFKVTCYDHVIASTSSVKYLDINIENLLSRQMNVNNILSKVNDRLEFMYRHSSSLYSRARKNLVMYLVYKLKKILLYNFSAQFIKMISHYKKIGYNINILQQTACLVVNPTTVGNFAFLFTCIPAGRTPASMKVPTSRLIYG